MTKQTYRQSPIFKSIKSHYKACDDQAIFDSLFGAGPVVAPRLLVVFGENRARYKSAEEIQRYAGIAPVLERSGKQSWTHWRYSCPKFLRQSFVEWAGESVRYSFWAKAYYEQEKQKGKPHQTIVHSLAFKWICIIFRCWLNRTPYDESTYLKALRKRGSPLLQFATLQPRKYWTVLLGGVLLGTYEPRLVVKFYGVRIIYT